MWTSGPRSEREMKCKHLGPLGHGSHSNAFLSASLLRGTPEAARLCRPGWRGACSGALLAVPRQPVEEGEPLGLPQGLLLAIPFLCIGLLAVVTTCPKLEALLSHSCGG